MAAAAEVVLEGAGSKRGLGYGALLLNLGVRAGLTRGIRTFV